MRSDAGPVDLEVAAKRAQEELVLLAVLDVRVPEVESELAVGVGIGNFARIQERPPGLVLRMQGARTQEIHSAAAAE